MWNSKVASLPAGYPDIEWQRVDAEPIDDLVDGHLVWAHRIDHAPSYPFDGILVSLDAAIAKKDRERRLHSARMRETVLQRRLENERRRTEYQKSWEAKKAIARDLRRSREDEFASRLPEGRLGVGQYPTEISPGLWRCPGGGWDIDTLHPDGWRNYGRIALMRDQALGVYWCDVETKRLRGRSF